MDSIVTARIPVEVKNQVSEILESLGSNTTQLINAAFEYVLVTGIFPMLMKVLRWTLLPKGLLAN